MPFLIAEVADLRAARDPPASDSGIRGQSLGARARFACLTAFC